MSNPVILNRKSLTDQKAGELKKSIEYLKSINGNITPILATIIVGDDPASATYIKMESKHAVVVG